MRTLLYIGNAVFLVHNQEETRNALVKALEHISRVTLHQSGQSYDTVPADCSVEIVSDDQFERRFGAGPGPEVKE